MQHADSRVKAVTFDELEAEVLFHFRNRWKDAQGYAKCEIPKADIDEVPPELLTTCVITRKLLNVDLSRGIVACLPGIRRAIDLVIQNLVEYPGRLARVRVKEEEIIKPFFASEWARYGQWKPKVTLLERNDGLYLSVRMDGVGVFRRRGRCRGR